MTDQQIRDEVVTLLVAGHETTANALTFAWGNIACDDAIYRKAREEVDEVLGSRAPTPEDIKNLPYIGQIFHESLRKYPPLYILDRQTFEPIVLGDCEIPTNTKVLFAPYTVHRREEIYPDPERFDPERFAEGRMKDIPRMGFIPFSGGHRVCIGRPLALMEAVLIMARILQKVKLETLGGGPPAAEPLVTLRPDPSYRLSLVRR